MSMFVCLCVRMCVFESYFVYEYVSQCVCCYMLHFCVAFVCFLGAVCICLDCSCLCVCELVCKRMCLFVSVCVSFGSCVNSCCLCACKPVFYSAHVGEHVLECLLTHSHSQVVT